MCHLFTRVFLRDFLPCSSLYMIDLEYVKSHWQYYWKSRCRNEKIRREKFPSVKIIQCKESWPNEIKQEENLFIFLKKKIFLEVAENLWKRSAFLKNNWLSNITDTGVSVVLAKPRHIAKTACQHIVPCMEMCKYDCTPYDHRTANKKLFVIFKKWVDSR